MTTQIKIVPNDQSHLARICGPLNQHLKQIEEAFGIKVNLRGEQFHIDGESAATQAAEIVLQTLCEQTLKDDMTAHDVHLLVQQIRADDGSHSPHNEAGQDWPVIAVRKKPIQARGANQAAFIRNLQSTDVNFAVGPAGTGKTYVAVAAAVQAFEQHQAERLILVRPAVEAGERLGFLPGDLNDKVDPYLRPIYDALYDLLGFEQVERMFDRQVIEVAPLAFMRGRTLSDAFVILDEAQNTTIEQMKMFLTRIGFGSRAVITGDLSQTDLPHQQVSGLKNALRILQGVEGVAFNHFTAKDVVRHPLVRRIIEAYQKHDS